MQSSIFPVGFTIRPGFFTFYYKIHSLSRYLFSAGSFLNTPVKFSLINSSFNQTVLSLSGSKNLLSHIHSREKGGFQIIQKLLRTSGPQPDCSASADPRPRWKAGRDNRLCQSCEEGLPPQSIVAVACQRRTRLSACSARVSRSRHRESTFPT